MHPSNPLSASGQAAGLFPGREFAGTPSDRMPDADLTGAEVPVYSAVGQPGNAHVHVGALVLGALIGLIVLHLLGFRFAGDVSVGR